MLLIRIYLLTHRLTLVFHVLPRQAQQMRTRSELMIAILERVQLFGETPLLDDETGAAELF
jgi:hypothetical protein